LVQKYFSRMTCIYVYRSMLADGSGKSRGHKRLSGGRITWHGS